MDAARQDSPATLEIWKGLVGQALRVGVPYEEARDLASQALLQALGAYDGGRGDFGPFCRTILANLVRNHWRDRRPTDPHDPESDLRAAADDPLADVLTREGREFMRDLADRLLATLAPSEAAFFLALAEVAREAETVAVTAAARRLGIAPLKGWDLFRRIQRQARRLQTPPSFMVSDVREEPPALPSVLRSPVVTEERAGDDGLASPPPARVAAGFPALLLLAGCASAGFGDFAATLTPTARARLAELTG